MVSYIGIGTRRAVIFLFWGGGGGGGGRVPLSVQPSITLQYMQTLCSTRPDYDEKCIGKLRGDW